MYDFLKSFEFNIWKDDEGGITGNVLLDMANAVQNAGLMIVCASEPYCISECCRLELEYGHQMKKEMILIRLDPNLNFSGKGSVGLILGSKLYFEFSIIPRVIFSHQFQPMKYLYFILTFYVR